MNKYRFLLQRAQRRAQSHKADMSFESLVLKGWVFDMKLQELYGSSNQHFEGDLSPDKG